MKYLIQKVMEYLNKNEKDCFDLFNFYYNCTFYQSLLTMFTEPNIIKLNVNYTLMSLLII